MIAITRAGRLGNLKFIHRHQAFVSYDKLGIAGLTERLDPVALVTTELIFDQSKRQNQNVYKYCETCIGFFIRVNRIAFTIPPDPRHYDCPRHQ